MRFSPACKRRRAAAALDSPLPGLPLPARPSATAHSTAVFACHGCMRLAGGAATSPGAWRARNDEIADSIGPTRLSAARSTATPAKTNRPNGSEDTPPGEIPLVMSHDPTPMAEAAAATPRIDDARPRAFLLQGIIITSKKVHQGSFKKKDEMTSDVSEVGKLNVIRH